MPAAPRIKDTAEEARDLLDGAKYALSKVRTAHRGEKDVVKAIEEQNQQLADTRELLGMLMFQDDLQVSYLTDPLAEVKKTLEKLVKVLAEGKPDSLEKVANAVGDVSKTTMNMQDRLPGNYFEASRLRAEDGAVQLAGPVVENYKLKGRVRVIARDNTAVGGSVQVGSLYSGDPRALVALQEGARRRQEGQKGDVRITK